MLPNFEHVHQAYYCYRLIEIKSNFTQNAFYFIVNHANCMCGYDREPETAMWDLIDLIVQYNGLCIS